MTQGAPLILGLGGTQRPGSSSERACRVALDALSARGFRTRLIGGPDLDLPMYDPRTAERSEAAQQLVAALREADGILLSCPSYHGGVSGMIKNALDYVEDIRDDDQVYFDGKVVGTIVCARGWQGAGSTLTELRSIVHALRGWNTPLAVTINTASPPPEDGSVPGSAAIDTMTGQMADFLRLPALARSA